MGPEEPAQHIQAPTAPHLSKTRLIAIFTGLALAVFVGALDETIVATAAVAITSEFSAFELYGWVSVSYLVTLIAVQPLYGSISNIFGRKWPMMVAAAVFLGGSAACGWATNMPVFIAARAISGVGAGGLTGLSFIIVADTFPLEERPKYQSILMSGFGVAAVSGPILGGVFSREATWRWCFWINLPIIGFTIFVLLFFLRVPSRTDVQRLEAIKKFDYIGAVLIMSTVTCFVLPMSLGGDSWPWKSAQVIVLYIVSGISAVAFVLVEKYIAKDGAIIPIRLMSNRRLVAAWMSLFFYCVVFTSFLYYMPIWFQVVEGRNATITGLLLVPYLFGLVIVGILYSPLIRLASFVPRIHPIRTILHIGCVLFLLGIILCGILSRDTPLAGVVLQLLVFGAGSGLVLQTSFISAQAAVQDSDVAMANSLAVVFEYLGGAVGLAISATVHRQSILREFGRIPTSLVSPERLDEVLKNPELINHTGAFSPEAQHAIQDAFVQGLLLTFRVLIAFAGIVFFNAFFVGQRRTAPTDVENRDGDSVEKSPASVDLAQKSED